MLLSSSNLQIHAVTQNSTYTPLLKNRSARESLGNPYCLGSIITEGSVWAKCLFLFIRSPGHPPGLGETLHCISKMSALCSLFVCLHLILTFVHPFPLSCFLVALIHRATLSWRSPPFLREALASCDFGSWNFGKARHGCLGIAKGNNRGLWAKNVTSI